MSAQGARSRSRPKLLLVGAGPTEVGHQQQGKPNLRGAVLPHLLDNLVVGAMGRLFPGGERGFDMPEIRYFDSIQIIPSDRRTNGLRSNDARKIRRAMFLAETMRLDGVVAVIDRESKKHPDRAERMRQGREAYRRTAGGVGPACAVGAACRCIETWLLADPAARKQVFGAKVRTPFSGDPEKRPNAKALKRYIRQYCEKQHLDRSSAYEDLAQSARPSELRKRCLTSYRPFADEVTAEIAPLLKP